MVVSPSMYWQPVRLTASASLWHQSSTSLSSGSSISGSYALTLSAEKLNTLGELDFANCDNTAANRTMDGNGEQKLRTAVNQLPPDFRLDLTPTTSFSAVLN